MISEVRKLQIGLLSHAVMVVCSAPLHTCGDRTQLIAKDQWDEPLQQYSPYSRQEKPPQDPPEKNDEKHP